MMHVSSSHGDLPGAGPGVDLDVSVAWQRDGGVLL